MRTVKRIIKIHKIDAYKVYCLFNNGEHRIIDFKQLFHKWNVKKGDVEYPLIRSIKEFQKLQLKDGTLVWKNIGLATKDEKGKKLILPYDLDPIVLYEASTIDPDRTLEIGLMIRQSRKELGLTQEQLALKSGTSKHYISRIENNKSGIEWATLVKIIEGGLGKKIQINVI